MASVHPRCNQHGLVAPDGMCVLCRKQASSGPPASQQQPGVAAPLKAAEATSLPDNKCAALLVGVALLTMATTYVLDTAKAKELATAQAQLQRSEVQRQHMESERLQELLVAAVQTEELPLKAAPEQETAELDTDRNEVQPPDPQ